MSDDDFDLFRRTIGKVRRLDNDKIDHPTPRPKPIAKFRRQDEDSVMVESMHGETDPAEMETGDELLFKRSNVSPSLLKKLRRGRLSIEAEIDLHGLNSTEAHDALAEFLLEALSLGSHCVRVIHGKGLRSGPGGPVIKKQVGRWLRRRNEVIAFCSAQPFHGGTGALYVLLRP
ncbi:MAG: Smr/MutS family protein [Gammaproteobacteria bacterium]